MNDGSPVLSVQVEVTSKLARSAKSSVDLERRRV